MLRADPEPIVDHLIYGASFALEESWIAPVNRGRASDPADAGGDAGNVVMIGGTTERNLNCSSEPAGRYALSSGARTV